MSVFPPTLVVSAPAKVRVGFLISTTGTFSSPRDVGGVEESQEEGFLFSSEAVLELFLCT